MYRYRRTPPRRKILGTPLNHTPAAPCVTQRGRRPCANLNERARARLSSRTKIQVSLDARANAVITGRVDRRLTSGRADVCVTTTTRRDVRLPRERNGRGGGRAVRSSGETVADRHESSRERDVSDNGFHRWRRHSAGNRRHSPLCAALLTTGK